MRKSTSPCAIFRSISPLRVEDSTIESPTYVQNVWFRRKAVCSSHSTMQSVKPQLQRGTTPAAIKARSSGHPFASKTNDNEELLRSYAPGPPFSRFTSFTDYRETS